MDFTFRLSLAKSRAQHAWHGLSSPYPECCLFFSTSDGLKRAVVVHARGRDFESVWEKGVRELESAMRAHDLSGKWLRVDWVEEVQEVSCTEFDKLLRRTKRNYFRHGLAFDPGLDIALTEQELNANAVLYGGSNVPHATFNDHNLRVYGRSRFGRIVNRTQEAPLYLLSTSGIFVDESSRVYSLGGPGLDAGRRRMEKLDEADIVQLVESASGYLARQVGADGRFAYGYFPCFDRPIQTYNTLRHASTTYAMVEAWAETRCPELKAAIERSLNCLTTALMKTVNRENEAPMSMLVDTGDEIKLGGNAVLILALTKYCEVTGTRDYLPVAESLARGIGFMQDPDTGRFVHVLHASDLSVKAENRIIYYDGEAAFALMRLYRATGNEAWLAMVEKAFEHFIEAEHWRAHDHWLAYCVNELTLYRPEEKYFRFALQNVAGYLDFVANRITTFPTLLELMMAARSTIERLVDNSEYSHLLQSIDLEAFQRALERRAHRLLDGYFWPEFAMYMRNPSRIVGSFFIRHHAFRVRIDDVEHYLSGYVAYLQYVRQGRPALRPAATRQRSTPVPGLEAFDAEARFPLWTADSVAAATAGTWHVPPGRDWSASGLCTWRPAMLPGNMVVVRTPGAGTGVPPAALAKLEASAFLTQDSSWRPDTATPVLYVPSLDEAILAMGRYARERLAARVLAVTGSAGKTTTVAMLADALSRYGEVAMTRHNANLPRGIAWNLASFPRSARYAVLELAIGRMHQNAVLTRPDVAIFTNIAPAHLAYHHTLERVADKKSEIFLGMGPGGTAVLNRDMAQWDRVYDAACRRGLNIVTYGQSVDAEVRLLDYSPADNRIVADLHGRRVAYRMAAAGHHMAMNSLAVLAAVHALGLPAAAAVEALTRFTPLAGRGERFPISVNGRSVTVVDDSYNANPASMAAALQAARRHPAKNKLLVLGDMLELGAREAVFHRDLADAVRAVSAAHVVLCGNLMRELADALGNDRVTWYEDVAALNPCIHGHLDGMDYVLVKGSGATRLGEVVETLRNAKVPVPPAIPSIP